MASCSRKHRDDFLLFCQKYLVGDVLDIGGEKVNKKGGFRPEINRSGRWIYANISIASKPDILCDGSSLPLANNVIDSVVLCEVLEHVVEPAAVIRECFRVLKIGGHAIVTMPFLYPIHGDPADYQRWTSDKLRREFEIAGLSVIEIQPLGGAFSVIYDILLNFIWRSKRTFLLRLFERFLVTMRAVFLHFDGVLLNTQPYITTGWGCIVRKNAFADGSYAGV